MVRARSVRCQIIRVNSQETLDGWAVTWNADKVAFCKVNAQPGCNSETKTLAGELPCEVKDVIVDRRMPDDDAPCAICAEAKCAICAEAKPAAGK